VTILSADLLLVNRQEVPRSRVRGRARARLAESATRRVLVRCEDTVPHAAFVSVLDDARACGAAGISVVGGNS